MRKYTTDKLSRMGRRRFLQTMVTLGVTGTGLNYMTKDALADLTNNPESEVPRLGYLEHTNHEAVENGTQAPRKEPIYYTISRDKWRVVETAHDAAARIDDLLDAKFDSSLFQTGVTTITSGHRRKKAVHVDYVVQRDDDGNVLAEPSAAIEAVRDALPATVTGVAGRDDFETKVEDIPVLVEKREVSSGSTSGGAYSDFYYDYQYRPVPASAAYKNEAEGTICTMGTPAYDNERNDYVMVTAGHCMTDSGQDIHQPDLYNQIGNSTSEFQDNDDETFDAGVISLSADHTYRFADNDGDNDYSITPIYGTLSWTTIKDNEGNSDYSMMYRGAKSGHVNTYIEKADSNEQYFWLENDSGDGDSGCPMYHVRFSGGDGRAYIGGINEGYYYSPKDGDIDCAGTYIGKIEDRYSLDV